MFGNYKFKINYSRRTWSRATEDGGEQNVKTVVDHQIEGSVRNEKGERFSAEVE